MFLFFKGWVTVPTWARSMGYNNMTEDALELFNQSKRPWSMKLNGERQSLFEQDADENNIWSLYKDTKDKLNLRGQYWKDTLLRRAWMFENWLLPNADGKITIFIILSTQWQN